MEALKGPIAPAWILSRKVLKMGLLPLLRGCYGGSVPSVGVLDRSTTLAGRDSQGVYMPLARISRTEFCRIRKNCHVPFGDRTQNSRAVTLV